MNKKNSVFIATSLNGYFADKNRRIDRLNSIPNPENDATGYTEFTNNIDALFMVRTTFETVCGFDVDWPYDKPVFVLVTNGKKYLKVIKEKDFWSKEL